MNQPITSVRWIPVRNTDTVPVPPFGAMEIAGPIDDEGTVPITRPTKDGQTDVLFNWIGMIPAGGVGQGHQAFPAVVGYSVDNEEGLPPSDGEIWGTKTDEWLLSRERPGFRIVGDGVDGLCNIVRMTANLLLMVQITSTTPDDGRYPAQERYYDPVAKTWTTGNACWWVDANGAAAGASRYYLPMLAGFANGRRVYQGANTSLQVVEVLSGVDLNPCDKIIVPAGFLSSSSGSTANFPYATNSAGGFMSNAAQSFAGLKTFEDPIKATGSMSGTLANQTLHIGKIDTTQPGLFRGENSGVASQCVEMDGSRLILQHRNNVGTPDNGTVLYAIRDSAGSLLDGATGTSGGGDTVTGGIITTLGSGPSGIDGGTF